jgi:hypothetical protein
MKIMLFFFSVLFLVIPMALGESSPTLLRDWKATQAQLALTFHDDLNNPFAGSELLENIKSSNNRQMFLEMSAQADYPGVALAGFICLKERFPKDAIGAAVHILLETKSPLSLIDAPIYDFLGKQPDTAEMRAALSEAADIGQYQRTNFEMLMLALPYKIVYDWYHTDRRPALCATSEAVLLDHLFGEAQTHGVSISSNMVSALNKLQFFPGFPRVVFICHASVDEAVIRTNLEMVLEESNVPIQTIVILHHRKRKLFDEILASDTSISQETRDRVKQLLKRKPVRK